MNSKFKGLVFGIIAAIAYGTNPLFSLPLYAEGMTPDSVLFYHSPSHHFYFSTVFYI